MLVALSGVCFQVWCYSTQQLRFKYRYTTTFNKSVDAPVLGKPLNNNNNTMSSNLLTIQTHAKQKQLHI